MKYSLGSILFWDILGVKDMLLLWLCRFNLKRESSSFHLGLVNGQAGWVYAANFLSEILSNNRTQIKLKPNFPFGSIINKPRMWEMNMTIYSNLLNFGIINCMLISGLVSIYNLLQVIISLYTFYRREFHWLH